MKKYSAVVVCLAALTAGLLTTIATMQLSPQQQQQNLAYAFLATPEFSQKAPVVTSGDNVYIVWWTDKGTPNTNGELMFRASSDNGGTFGDKINLSNTTDADSVDAEVAADGDSVFVSWWERNATSNEPVLRVSTDNGQTFGPLLKLATNGTIGGS